MMGFTRHTLTLAALSSVAFATEARSAAPPPEATVTVSAEAQPVEVVRTPAQVRILEGEDLARLGCRTLAELMEVMTPGAVMPTGGAGASTSAFLNGTLSRNVVILLDGLRLNDPTALSPDLGALSLVGIARVEVVLGPSSVLYGSDAIGGVISLTSHGAGERGAHGEVGLRLGQDDQRGASTRLQVTGDRGWFAAGAEGLRQGSSFPGDAFHQAGGFLRMGTKLGGAELTGFYRNSGQTATLPFATEGYPAARAYEPGRETRARQEAWGLDLRWGLSPTLKLEASAQALSGLGSDPDGPARQQTTRDFRRVEEQLTLHWTPSGQLRVSGRLEAREDASHAQNYYDPGTYAAVPYRGEGHDGAAALEARWNLAAGLDVVGGLRRDAGHRDLWRSDTHTRERAGEAEATTWRAGLNWVVSPALRLYAGAGAGFRMPNTTEFTLNAQAQTQDHKAYALTPERSRSVQVGATGLLAGHWEYRLEAQRTRVEDLLAYTYDTSWAWPPLFTSHYVNAGAIRAQSVEGALGWRGGGDWAMGLDLVARAQETRDLDHDVDGQRYGQQNSAILRHPFFTAGVTAFTQSARWRFDARMQRVGPRYDLNDTTYGVQAIREPYRDLSLGLSHTPMKGLTLSLRGEHLLQPRQGVSDWLQNRWASSGDAAMVYGFPAPAPRVSLGLTWTW